MIRAHKSAAAALAGVMACSAAWAAPLTVPPDAPPADPATVLRELDAAEKKRTTSESSRREALASTLGRALAGGSAAAGLYEEAVKNTAYEGHGGDAKSFADWKSKNDQLLRSDQLQNAVAFHVRYLLIGLQLRESGQTEAGADRSFEYARAFARQFADEKFFRLEKPAEELLGKPVSEGPFAKWLFLTERLPDNKSWEPAAGNIGGILDKNVRAVWRTKADPRLLATWDLQLDFQGKRANQSKLDLERQKFETIVKPRLLFGRASDRTVLGQPNLATKEILGLIKAYPDHPDWPEWAAKLRATVAPAPPATP